MEQTIYLLASTCLNVALRVWMKDKDSYMINSVLDVKKLAEKLGCSYFSEKELEQNINKYLLSVSGKLSASFLLEGIDEPRKKEILDQLISDINDAVSIDENTISIILGNGDLKKIIEDSSRNERETWSDREKGIYNNCLRYAVDAVVKFIQLLPMYTPEAIQVLYQKGCEAFDDIEEQLDTIIKILKSQHGTLDEYKEFETDYLRWVENTYKKVELFGAGLLRRSAKRYNISTSYIELSCAEDGSEELLDNSIQTSHIFDRNNVVWLSGEAGGGKTTFVQWLAINAATNSMDNLEGLIPIVIKLRGIATFPFSIQGEIERLTDLKCPDGWIDYLVKSDKMLLLLDGLDEVADYDRSSIYDFVEDTVEKWDAEKCKKSKMVITSRPYVQDILDVKHVNYRVLRMNSRNIEKFVRYWHSTVLTELEGSETEIETRSNRLVENITNVPSIKSIAGTPLLCAMICALNYINNETIPSNRNELYEKCCEMMIDGRDKERHIASAEIEDLNRLDYTRKSIILEKIALKMLAEERVEMEKRHVIACVETVLKESTLLESFSIKQNPGILVDFLVQRTGILREPSIGKMDFVHKTFLEYLGAKALNMMKDDDLILKNAINPFWKETIIMSFNQMEQRQSADILMSLLERYYCSENMEYIFMAALCTQNASDTKICVRDRINDEIQKLIPPKQEYIEKLSEAGEYILPFLIDKQNYSATERKNCLKLLEYIIYYEAYYEGIEVIESYLLGAGTILEKVKAARLLAEYPEHVIEEARVREKVYQAVNNTMIHGECCILSWDMLYLIEPGKTDRNSNMSKIMELKVVNTRDSYDDEIILDLDVRVYDYFLNLRKLSLVNIVFLEMLEIIEYPVGLETLELVVSENDLGVFDTLRRSKRSKQIKELKYDSPEMTYICPEDLVPFSNIESISLKLTNEKLEFEIDEWDYWENLRCVRIMVCEDVFYEMRGRIEYWENQYRNISFDLNMV